jgi:hypothetical protein
MTFPPAALAAFFALILALPAAAKELAGPSSGCSLTIPDDWEIISFKPDSAGYSVASRSPDKLEGVSLFVKPTSGKTLDDIGDYVSDYSQYLQAQSAAVTKLEKRMLNGREFEIITATEHTSSQDVPMVTWLTVANGKIYQITLTDLDPAKKAVLDSIVKSFALK